MPSGHCRFSAGPALMCRLSSRRRPLLRSCPTVPPGPRRHPGKEDRRNGGPVFDDHGILPLRLFRQEALLRRVTQAGWLQGVKALLSPICVLN